MTSALYDRSKALYCSSLSCPNAETPHFYFYAGLLTADSFPLSAKSDLNRPPLFLASGFFDDFY